MNIKKIIEFAKNNKEGFTAYYKDGKLVSVSASKNKRYVVADKTKIVYIPRTDKTSIYSAVKDGSYIGGWYDKESNKYLIEQVDVVSRKSDAIELGKKRKQKAIFDLQKFKEIKIHHKEKVSGISETSPIVEMQRDDYYNLLTGRKISKTVAKRLLSYFERHPDATLYEAYGGSKYDKTRPWKEHPESIKKVYEKDIQVIKTKDISGRDVYYNPLKQKKVSKQDYQKKQRFDYYDGDFKISLYRITADEYSVYHIIAYPIGKTMISEQQINEFFRLFKRYWTPDAKRIMKNLFIQHPLGKIMTMSIKFQVIWHLTQYGIQQDGAVTCGNVQFTPQHTQRINTYLEHAQKQFLAQLHNYKAFSILNVRINISALPTPLTRSLAKSRMGVIRRV